MSINERERRRQDIIYAVANRYHVLIDPELLEVVLDMYIDPVGAIGKVVARMGHCEAVVTLHHYGVVGR